MPAKRPYEHDPADEPWDSAETPGGLADDIGDDPEAPQEQDIEAFGDSDEAETDTVECVNCGREIAEFADRCPYCGEWVSQGGPSGAGRHGLLWFFLVLIGFLALAYWLVGAAAV